MDNTDNKPKSKSKFFVPYIAPILCLMGGAILAYNGIDGWGWLFFIAILIYPV